jgi:hypothetical protein
MIMTLFPAEEIVLLKISQPKEFNPEKILIL